MRRSRAARIILLTLFILACGKRGDPMPPVPITPKAVTDLAATQQGTTVVVSWTYPSLTAAGQKLIDFRRVHVYRYIEELPASLMGGDPKTATDTPPGTPEEVALFSQVRPLTAPQFLKLKETIATMEKDELAGMTEGARLIFEDHPRLRAEDGRPVRATYGVVTVAEEQSDLSNLATVVPLDVPRAPRELTAAVTPDAVTLKWEPPSETLTGQGKPSVVGYNVYRFSGETPPSDLGAPVNGALVSETTYRDAPPYGKYRYAVTAVQSVGPPLLQSVTSNAVEVEYTDLLPPPVPPSLTALPEERGVRLIWESVEAPDLAGYRVYRERDGKRVLINKDPMTDTFLVDTEVEPNVSYTYRVTSVDKLGNESNAAVAPALIRE